MTDYLTRAPVVHTDDLERAREAVTRVYLPHQMDAPTGAMDMRLNAASSRILTVGYLTYGSQTRLRMPATESCYHVNLDIAGETWGDRQGTLVHTTAGRGGTVLTPHEDTTIRWSPDAEQLILKVSRISLESHLSDLLGSPVTDPVTFDFGLDLDGDAGRALLRAVEFLATELDRPDGLSASPLARTQLESYVLTRLLQAGHHQYSDALLGRDDHSRLGRLAPVIAHIEEHADAELTPEVLARVGCVSVRTLHAAFRERLGDSPMGYVRRVRLQRVRSELLAADPGATLVTDVATRWGFYHQSRFAQQYRALFDELPSTTLQR